MMRRILVLAMAATLGFSTIACVGEAPEVSNQSQNQKTEETAARTNRLSDGEYPVQQATYDDGIGEYSLMLLNTKAGESSTYRVTNLPMARLSDEDIANGKKSHLKLEGGQPSLFLTEDFKIQYVHNVTETRQNTQTGQPETVVVRQESGFWAPFAGAVAGQALGSLLFRPQYYVPPVYQPGLVTGYGGYGRTYNGAVESYQSRYRTPPAEVRNRQAFRTTGQLRSPGQTTTPSRTRTSDRPTGSGYGSTDLRQNDRTRYNPRPRSNTGFGSGGRSRSFGGRRR